MENMITYIYMGGVLLSTFIFAQVVNYLMNKQIIESLTRMKVKNTQQTFIKHLVLAVIYIIGFGVAIYMLPGFKNLSLSIFASSGVVALVVGFASQHALANIVSGIFIIIFQPFRVDDRIRLQGKDVWGIVEDITLRHTIIRTYENKRVVIPNSIISTEIIENTDLTDERICRFVDMGISYDSDIDKAMQIMREEALAHPDTIEWRTQEDKDRGEQDIPVRVVGFGDSSVNLRAWTWYKDWRTAYNASCDLNKTIKQRFDKEGIEIPFPYRTIVYKEKKDRYQ